MLRAHSLPLLLVFLKQNHFEVYFMNGGGVGVGSEVKPEVATPEVWRKKSRQGPGGGESREQKKAQYMKSKDI